MPKILITGNKEFGLAKELYKLYPDAGFLSRSTGYDLTSSEGQRRCAEQVLETDVFVNCAALWKFNQTVLLDTVYKKCVENKHNPYIGRSCPCHRSEHLPHDSPLKALCEYAESLLNFPCKTAN